MLFCGSSGRPEGAATGLINVLMKAQAQLRLSKLEAAELKLDLLILDEVGFVPFSKVGVELLFGFLTDRYERGICTGPGTRCGPSHRGG